MSTVPQFCLKVVVCDNDRMYKAERQKFLEAVARGDAPRVPAIVQGIGGHLRLDARDLMKTKVFRKHMESIEKIRLR